MKRDNINYLVVGTFVLVVFAMLMVFLYQLTGRGGPSDIYTVTYNNVAGIKFGTPVLYEGYQVGQVESIEPVPSAEGMSYKLELSVAKGWRIPSDSMAQVVASGLLSAMTIEIKEGDSERMLEPGSEIEGREAVSIFAAVNDLASNFKELSDDSIRPLLNTLADNIEKLTDELLQLARDDIRPVFNNLNHKIDQVRFVEETNQLVARLNTAADGLQSMLNEDNQGHVASTVDNLNQASVNLNDLLNNIDTTRGTLDQMLVGVDDLVSSNKQDLRISVRKLRTALETISANIDAITYHMEGTSRNMHEFSRYLRENPGALIRGGTQPAEEMETQESQQ